MKPWDNLRVEPVVPAVKPISLGEWETQGGTVVKLIALDSSNIEISYEKLGLMPASILEIGEFMIEVAKQELRKKS